MTTIYRSLDPERKEIRLLVVKPGTLDSPVQCEIRHRTLNSSASVSPEYETISYAWGDDFSTKTIWVGGEKLEVRTTCEEVLRFVRLPDRERTLWIDAVCINQKDDAEKDSQVSIMCEVYRGGCCNLIFLGVEHQISAVRIKTAVQRVLDDKRLEMKSQNPPRLDEDRSGRYSYLTNGFRCEQDVEALQDLFTRRWFTRLWVLQEAVLSRDNKCMIGQSSFALSDILKAAVWLMYRLFHLPAGLGIRGIFNASSIARLLNPSTMKITVESEDPLANLLTLANGLDASESGDYIYALSGLYKYLRTMQQFGHIERDYEVLHPALLRNEDNSLSTIYRDATRVAIERRKSLTPLLSAVPSPLEIDNSIPSWVPRYDKKDGMPTGFATFYLAGGKGPVVFGPSGSETSADPDVLSVYGICITRVRKKADQYLKPMAQFGPRQMQEVWETAETLLSMRGSTCTQPNVQELAVVMTLAAGCNIREVRRLDESGLRDFATKIMPNKDSSRQQNLVIKRSRNDDFRQTPIDACSMSVMQACQNRRLFVTEIENLGLGPIGLLEGDAVVILLSHIYPVVMRPPEKPGDYWKIIGDCYMNGIMYGEAVKRCEAKRRKFDLFHIR